jgi:hypothetical protein
MSYPFSECVAETHHDIAVLACIPQVQTRSPGQEDAKE